jgi:hypothetical protein
MVYRTTQLDPHLDEGGSLDHEPVLPVAISILASCNHGEEHIVVNPFYRGGDECPSNVSSVA